MALDDPAWPKPGGPAAAHVDPVEMARNLRAAGCNLGGLFCLGMAVAVQLLRRCNSLVGLAQYLFGTAPSGQCAPQRSTCLMGFGL